MAHYYTSSSALIGHTPLLRLTRIEAACHLPAQIYAKLEYLNPTGSVKDRAALFMIEEGERQGRIRPGTVIIEPTSGNTGIGLAGICAARGYRLIIVMPDSMSQERRTLMRAYGAELILTEGAKGMRGAIERANALAAEIPDSFIPGQFDNPANPQAHYATTGPEICEALDGAPDVFVCGVGTGGTISGVGRYLKEVAPQTRIVAVEPRRSPVLSTGVAGAHGIQGIGAGFIPRTLDTHVYDEVLPVADEDAYAAARMLGKTEGILCGISSGAALHAAIELAGRAENAARRIVALLPDTGERYLSTGLFDEGGTP